MVATDLAKRIDEARLLAGEASAGPGDHTAVARRHLAFVLCNGLLEHVRDAHAGGVPLLL